MLSTAVYVMNWSLNIVAVSMGMTLSIAISCVALFFPVLDIVSAPRAHNIQDKRYEHKH